MESSLSDHFLLASYLKQNCMYDWAAAHHSCQQLSIIKFSTAESYHILLLPFSTFIEVLQDLSILSTDVALKTTRRVVRVTIDQLTLIIPL